jgi:DNA-binding response OmpR family regulator
MKILLIESDGAFAQELCTAIEARGVEARVTSDGKEGLELARADRPDLIVLCVELPKMSGYSVCNKLKKDDQLRSIPLVIISAEATPETFDQHRKLKTRAEGYLIKPFEPAALLELIGGLVALPPEPLDLSPEPLILSPEPLVLSGDEVVTLDDVELEAIEAAVEPPPEPLSSGSAGPGDDEDLKLLDEAFEGLASEEPAASAPTASGVAPSRPAAPVGAGLTVTEDLDRLEEADAALAALGTDEPPEADLASAAALFDASVSVREDAQASAAADIDKEAEIRCLEERVAELVSDLARATEAVQRSESEAAAVTARLGIVESELDSQRAGVEGAEQPRSAGVESRHAQERSTALEADIAARSEREAQLRRDLESAAERATAAERRATAAEERAQAAEARVRAADERARVAEQRARAAEQESAGLKLRLEEADQAATLKVAEAEETRRRVEAVMLDLEAARTRAATHERDVAALRPELEGVRTELSASRARAEEARADAERRIADLEAQNTKHEERVVKAYQKIKGDEKLREKTRKALAIALQLLEERTTAAAPPEVQPRRE